jgi:hypothetical protein
MRSLFFDSGSILNGIRNDPSSRVTEFTYKFLNTVDWYDNMVRASYFAEVFICGQYKNRSLKCTAPSHLFITRLYS